MIHDFSVDTIAIAMIFEYLKNWWFSLFNIDTIVWIFDGQFNQPKELQV